MNIKFVISTGLILTLSIACGKKGPPIPRDQVIEKEASKKQAETTNSKDKK